MVPKASTGQDKKEGWREPADPSGAAAPPRRMRRRMQRAPARFQAGARAEPCLGRFGTGKRLAGVLP
jgi:hypothetical protein